MQVKTGVWLRMWVEDMGLGQAHVAPDGLAIGLGHSSKVDSDTSLNHVVLGSDLG